MAAARAGPECWPCASSGLSHRGHRRYYHHHHHPHHHHPREAAFRAATPEIRVGETTGEEGANGEEEEPEEGKWEDEGTEADDEEDKLLGPAVACTTGVAGSAETP